MSTNITVDLILDNRLERSSYALNELIVALSIMEMICAGFVPVKIFQVPVETVLFLVLTYACTRITYDKIQVMLLVFLASGIALSFLTNDYLTFLRINKVNILAVLSLLYFSKVRFRSRLILPAFILTTCMIVIHLIYPVSMAPLIGLSTFQDFNESRFGGLFLNAHFNAYFMAIALIFYGHRKRLFGLGIPLLYFTYSKFVLVSYLANIIAELRPFKLFLNHRIIFIIVTGAGISLIWIYSDRVISYFSTDRLGSLAIILMQLTDPAYYHLLLNQIPTSNIDVAAHAKALYLHHDGHNEIGYFYLTIVCGVYISVFYLYLLFREVRFFRVFVFVSLLHIGAFVLTPLIIYMLVSYSREIEIHHQLQHCNNMLVWNKN